MLRLLALAALFHAQAPTPSFSATLLRDFDALDRDHDGALSDDEVTRAVLDPSVHGEDAAALAALHTYLSVAKDAPRLTKGWFAMYQPARLSLPEGISPAEKKRLRKAYAATPASLQSAFATDLRRLRRRGEVGLFAETGPSLSDIRQGSLGDCYFLAPLGAIMHRDPNEVRQMIKPDGEGYAVAFGDGKTVRVAGPTDAEVAMGGSSTANGLWVRVMEKAYGSRKFADGETGVRIARDGMNGGSSGVVAKGFTGHEFLHVDLIGDWHKPVTNAELAPKLEAIRQDLPRALAEHRLVLTGTRKAEMPVSITPNHAYAVFGFDPAADTITIWNPHGDDFAPKGPEGFEYGFRRAGGVFTMPLPLFARTFARLTIEKNTPVAAKG